MKRDYSNARTPQQNGVAERKNRTLIEAARTMLADSKLPTMFWTEAVRTACYVLNRVLVTRCMDSDSKCDEQFIIFPSYPSHSIQEAEPKDTSGDEVDDSPLDLLNGVPVPTGSPTDSFFNDKPTTRFPSPSDLGNNEPHSSTVEVSPVATKRINTIHPQSLIIGDHTSAVQTRSKVNKTTTGESAFISYIHDQPGVKKYEALMKGEFEMSAMGELTFFLGLQVQSPELGPPAILATIDETPYTITEDSVRSQLQLADDGGIDDLPIAEIYSGMDNLGYVTEGKLTFYKNKFSPQWRFLVHTILHCLSTKSGSWDQFGSSLAVALICLSDGRKFNWSSYIFKGMLNFEGQPMQLLAAMLPQDQEGAGAGAGPGVVISMDKSQITRKQSKTGKHGHENQKSLKRSQRFKDKARKVKPQSNPQNVSPWSLNFHKSPKP
ncbi:synaptobrevin, longin-like domain protein [Tanacetum coccineum]